MSLYPVLLFDGRSAFQPALARVASLPGAAPPTVVVNEEHRVLARQQLEASGIVPRAVVLEPFARDSAPAVGVVAFALLREDPEAVMLVVPANADIADPDAFTRAVELGAEAAKAQWLVALGADARSPAPGRSVIDCGAQVYNVPGCLQAARFIKLAGDEPVPARPAAPARRYSNSGIYVFGVAHFVVEMGRIDPQLEAACHGAAQSIVEDDGCLRIGADAFGRCRAVSLDEALYAHSDSAAVVPAGFPRAGSARVVYRPWGCYQDIDIGTRYRVKRITVNPGEKLSLQLHHHRAEHWVVVSGTARVERGDEDLLLTENQSTYIPVGMRHRLENPGRIPLQVIEVQSGAYVAEDDIVRIEDAYQRA